MVQLEKKKRVEEFKDLLKGAKCVVLNDFTGLDVVHISELREKCRQKDVVFRVIKNTLAKRSLDEMGLEELGKMLEGPTAVAVSVEDEVAPAQVLKSFADDYEIPRMKGGYVAGQVLDEEGITRLASLPGKETLLAQTVQVLQSPMRGLINCLGASLRDLVYVLKAVSEKKEAA